jgi:hypothetical protein
VADVDRRFRHGAADADRHQHRLDPVVARLAVPPSSRALPRVPAPREID